MERLIIDFINTHGIENVTRLLWVFVAVVIAVSVYLAMRTLLTVAGRGNPAQDALNRAFERQAAQLEEQDDEITAHHRKEAALEEQVKFLKKSLADCQDAVKRGGLPPHEEALLRQIITRQQNELRVKQAEIDRLNLVIEAYVKGM